MTTNVTIEHSNGPQRTMSVSFGEQETGYQRCCARRDGEPVTDPFAEPESVMKARLLGAAFITALEDAIPATDRSEAARVANIAKTDIEKAVTMGVKALHMCTGAGEATGEDNANAENLRNSVWEALKRGDEKITVLDMDRYEAQTVLEKMDNISVIGAGTFMPTGEQDIGIRDYLERPLTLLFPQRKDSPATT